MGCTLTNAEDDDEMRHPSGKRKDYMLTYHFNLEFVMWFVYSFMFI
jgi:hypothetical protein